MTLYASNGREKDEDSRVRRNAPRIKEFTVEDDGLVRGPELPDCPDGLDWCPRTKEWYLKWRVSPNAKLFTETDWEALLECCIIHNRIWDPNRSVGDTNLTNLMSELRRRVAVWGATHYDRVQLKMSIKTPQMEAEEANDIDKDAEEAVDYLTNLAKASAEKLKK